ncbi:MAG: OmpA family protein [Acidobacteriota bacterium]|jgi:outer membrane protein OmpA-like peptidoglycan-associated protein|nr:OmpA family protein [Acidobacteriota bacterium]
MRKTYRNSSLALVALMLALASQAFAQVGVLQVPAGQKMNLEGVVIDKVGETMTVRTPGNATYQVFVNEGTTIKEKKSNPFRGAKQYTQADLVPGLQVEVKGLGMNSGLLAAREIHFRDDDHIIAQAMDTRVVPVEKNLQDTQVRLGETERNAERLSGQIQELTAITNIVRDDAKAAQETADSAVAMATTAQGTADTARRGVRAANERITMLDEFDVKTATTIYFKSGSSALAREYQDSLGSFADQIQSERGYLIEVAGFASADGDAASNRRLSQRRAEAVIQYLAENFMIPMRRFVTPMGYGASQPVGDNRTRAGREENRRVEVRLLVSKGLTSAPDEVAYDEYGGGTQTSQAW